MTTRSSLSTRTSSTTAQHRLGEVQVGPVQPRQLVEVNLPRRRLPRHAGVAVSLEQKRGAAMTEFNILKGPPPAAPDAKLIAGPRRDPQKGMLIRAFSALKLQGFE